MSSLPLHCCSRHWNTFPSHPQAKEPTLQLCPKVIYLFWEAPLTLSLLCSAPPPATAAQPLAHCITWVVSEIPLLQKKLLFFFLFRAIPVADGSRIRAAAASLHHSHSNTGLSRICDLQHSLQQRWLLNPLCRARDQTRNLIDIS